MRAAQPLDCSLYTPEPAAGLRLPRRIDLHQLPRDRASVTVFQSGQNSLAGRPVDVGIGTQASVPKGELSKC